MDREPLTIDWKDLTKPEVDAKLERLRAVKSTLNHYEASEEVVGIDPNARGGTLLYNAAVFMALFGVLGGVLGWAFGEVLHFRPDARFEARQAIADYEQLRAQLRQGEVPVDVAEMSLASVKREFSSNPYFALYADDSLSTDERDRRMQELDSRDNWNAFLANVLFFGFSGMMIAVCLGMAEPLVDRNLQKAAIIGVGAAILGMLGGVAVALLIPKLHAALFGELGAELSRQKLILSKMVEWGVLGMFLAIAPGLFMGSFRRLLIGVAGGLAGGLIGGMLFVPLTESFNEHVGRFAGIVTIGTVAGAACGLIENAIKTGWLKVKAGLIAGKQFVIYRTPTYIGAHPSCHIYLWKDQQVGKRHAAVHLSATGVEIENLPLGGATLLNGKTVQQRTRLRDGDRLQVGRTVFEFHERRRKD
jgi:hypothetical protein